MSCGCRRALVNILGGGKLDCRQSRRPESLDLDLRKVGDSSSRKSYLLHMILDHIHRGVIGSPFTAKG